MCCRVLNDVEIVDTGIVQIVHPTRISENEIDGEHTTGPDKKEENERQETRPVVVVMAEKVDCGQHAFWHEDEPFVFPWHESVGGENFGNLDSQTERERRHVRNEMNTSGQFENRLTSRIGTR